MLISAILTTYNRPKLSLKALKSILDQTYDPLEIIVVEDASNSGIDDWIKKNKPNSIKYIRHETNNGLAAARNTGWEAASGKYVAFLDDDDVWKEDRIKKQIQLLKRLSTREIEQLGYIYCGKETQRMGSKRKSMPKQWGSMREEFKKMGPHTLSSTFLFKKEALKQVEGFDESLPSSIDHDIWMALAKNNCYVYAVKESLVCTNEKIGQRMIHNIENRIPGVEMYVKKWNDFFKEILGENKGEKYGKRYFTRTIGRLAADLITTGQVKEFFRVAKVIFRKSRGDWIYSSYILSRYSAGIILRRMIN
jgi:glycosyltransferase involved in cell wall biosynthesis